MLRAETQQLSRNLRSTRHLTCSPSLVLLPRTFARTIFSRLPPPAPNPTLKLTPEPQNKRANRQTDTMQAEDADTPIKPRPGTEPGTRDERIAFHRVRLVDPQTGELRRLAPLADIRAELLSDKDVRKRYSLILVANTPEPVVRLVNMGEQYRKTREQKLRARESAKFLGEKEIQLTWDTASVDHQRKMDQARESLQEGMRVSLVHAPKRGVRHTVTFSEMRERAQSTVDALADISREAKQREVGPRITVIHLDSIQHQSVQQQLEVAVPLGAAPHILQRRIADVEQALAAGKKVKVHFAEEKRVNSKKGSTEESLLSKFIPSEGKEEQKPEKWSRKKKDVFVDSVVAKLVKQGVEEWKPRDNWNSSTTLYLTATNTTDE